MMSTLRCTRSAASDGSRSALLSAVLSSNTMSADDIAAGAKRGCEHLPERRIVRPHQAECADSEHAALRRCGAREPGHDQRAGGGDEGTPVDHPGYSVRRVIMCSISARSLAGLVGLNAIR